MNLLRSLIIVMTIILVGCGANNKKGTDDSQLALIKTTNPPPVDLDKKDQSVAEQVKKDVLNFNELYDVAVIEGKKDILVAYKVRHFERFKMKKIEKDLKKTLKKKYPDEKITVSSDYKIFLEVVRLKEDMSKGKVTEKEAKKRLEEILKLQSALT
ncbi:hypothetical protein J2S13_002061 [Oikeobacillus pervagus]|uniref:Sporulation protein n=1 Tax=Oikeobacillus pervagus TaxID=1325931 RepID=A0AAJ1WJM7_9BACI|nr:YhcN/YlaJ family sporulation lipoprotein [Oikeobacillus pervagus]MDQ0215643.1 hypothetical protein [Oikeobacillus pervagus]